MEFYNVLMESLPNCISGLFECEILKKWQCRCGHEYDISISQDSAASAYYWQLVIMQTQPQISFSKF